LAWGSRYPWLGAVLAGTMILTAIPLFQTAAAILIAPRPETGAGQAVSPHFATALLAALAVLFTLGADILYTAAEFTAR
ncbi:MAG: hypothetical protein PHW69_06400, partial [Elusimicrobiaceae bacterium]|nr:hypothetical protein [Elusimicrobiaceae bacterium]